MEVGQPPQDELPLLIRGYLRAGARVCGEPACDPPSCTADVPMLVAIDTVDRRFAQHFGRSSGHAA